MQAHEFQYEMTLRSRLAMAVIVLVVVALVSSISTTWPDAGSYAHWSASRIIQYTALLGLAIVSFFLYRAERSARSGFEQSHVAAADTPKAFMEEPLSPHKPPRQIGTAYTGESLTLLPTILSGFVDNPESTESFLPLLREVERQIDAKCSAIFIKHDFYHAELPLVCTDPAARDCFVDLLRERTPASMLDGVESIQTFADPEHFDIHIIMIKLVASDGVVKGLLLIKRRFAQPLSPAEIALLGGLGTHMAEIICSTQRAQANRRVALYEERAVIARELHDSLAQSLSYLKIQTMRLQSLLQFSKGSQALNYQDADAILMELRTNLNLAYRQLRELITTFRLTMNGRTLSQALCDSVEEFENRSSIAFTLDNRVQDGLMSVDEELHVLQIIRECMSNIVRHAKANHAEISLHKDNSGIAHITVDDDGVGIEETPNPDRHYGLVIMQQRAHSLGGDMRVLHSADGGTRIRLNFPLGHANPDTEQLRTLAG